MDMYQIKYVCQTMHVFVNTLSTKVDVNHSPDQRCRYVATENVQFVK